MNSKSKQLLALLLLLSLSGCALLDLIMPSEDDDPIVVETNTVAEGFINSFDEALGVDSGLSETERSILKTEVTTNSDSILDSEDLTLIIPEIVGFYIEGLSNFTTISEDTRLAAVEAISTTSVIILNGTEDLISGSTTRAISTDTDTLLYILEQISKAIIENVPKCGFSADTYAEATEVTVKSLVGALDEGGLEIDTISDAAQSITKSAISQLAESEEYTDVGDAVTAITKGATEGAADISLEDYSQEDIAPLISSITQGAVEGLGEISGSEEEFLELLPQLTEGSTLAISEIEEELGDTITDAVQSIAQGSTEAIANISLINQDASEDIIAEISATVSQSSAENITGITADEIMDSVVSGVSEGAQAVSDIYDADTLADIIVINDEDGTAQDTSGATDIIDDAVSDGQDALSDELIAIREAIETVVASNWGDDHSLIPAQLAVFDAVIDAYPNTVEDEMGDIYDYAGWMVVNQMWDSDGDEQEDYADLAVTYLLKAAYDFDLSRTSAFWALAKLGEINMYIYQEYDTALEYFELGKERFEFDQWKQLYYDFKIVQLYSEMLDEVYDDDDFSGEKVAFVTEKYLPSALQIDIDNYPELVEADEWQFSSVNWRLAEAYKILEEWDSAIDAYDALLLSARENNYNVTMNIGYAYADKADVIEDDDGDYAGAITAYLSAIEALEDFETSIDAGSITVDDEEYTFSDYEVAKYWRYRAKYNRYIGDIYEDDDDDDNALIYYNIALPIFESITEANYPDITDEDDLWIFEDAYYNVNRIYRRTGRESEAIDAINESLNSTEMDLTDRQKALLYTYLADIYIDLADDAEDDDDTTGALDYIDDSITNAILAEELLYNDGDIEDDWDYFDPTSIFLDAVRDRIYILSDDYNDGTVTFTELIEYDDEVSTYCERMEALGGDEFYVESQNSLGRYYYAIMDVIGDEHTSFNDYASLAITIFEDLEADLPNLDIDSDMGSEIKEMLFQVYLMTGDSAGAETVVYDMIADPNVESENTASVLTDISWFYLEIMWNTYDSGATTEEELTSYISNTLIFGTFLYNDYADVEDGRFERYATQILSNLYYSYYHYQMEWGTDTADDIDDTKTTALIYLRAYVALLDDEGDNDEWANDAIIELDQ